MNRIQLSESYWDIRSKISLMGMGLLTSFLFNHPVAQVVILAFNLMLFEFAKQSVFKIFRTILPLLPVFILIILFAGFQPASLFSQADSKIVLFKISDYLLLTSGGLKMGCTYLLRLINMILMTTLLISGTPLDDFIQLFQKLKLPNTLAFMLTTAVRFIPELNKKRESIIEAQIARGADFKSGNIFRRYYLNMAVMIPLIINAIIMSDQLTMALLCRGFGYQDHWTRLNKIRLEVKDLLVILISVGGGAIAVYFRINTVWGQL